MKLEFAKLSLKKNLNSTDVQLVPFSDQFNDVYFSKLDGIAESEYVFFNGNELQTKWQSCENECFIIAETGFGTGLNIALTADKFNVFKRQYPTHKLKRLHFISFELHPIEQNQLKEIAANWPQFQAFFDCLIDQYPTPLVGNYRIQLDYIGSTLDLVFGDINSTIENIARPEAGIDAWFLDGFAPSKNQTMWGTQVIQHIQRLSRQNTSFATFTSAGKVKRELQTSGFIVNKIDGFAGKREMLIGNLGECKHPGGPKYHQRKGSTGKSQCTIIGGGLAGLLSAINLLARGYAVTLICQKQIGDGPSGNHIGGFYPALQADYSINSKFYWHCFQYAQHFYRQLNLKQAFNHDFCGALITSFNEKQLMRHNKMEQLALWPQTLARFVDKETASLLADIEISHPALYMEQAGWISPISLLNACLEACLKYKNFRLLEMTQLLGFTASNDEIELQLENEANNQYQTTTEILVLASGADTKHLLPDFDWRVTRGQVEHLPTDNSLSVLKKLICHKGYFTPSNAGTHAFGSTYKKDYLDLQTSALDTAENFKTHRAALPDEPWRTFLDEKRLPISKPRASLRCSTADHLPIVGNIPDVPKQTSAFHALTRGKPTNAEPINMPNCYLLSGLGSRGLTTAPICAELLADQISGRPLPLSQDLLDALNPNRFIIRALRKNK